jgi:hypothetical protein
VIMKREVTIEMLRSMIDYNPETGEMRWKERSGRARARAKTGESIGCPRPPYRTVSIYGNKFYLHRVAFALANNRWPEPICDHINGDPSDNRACNLREATHAQSAHNTRGQKSRSGVKGVHWQSQNKKWCVRVSANGRHQYFGSFESVDKAAEAARRAREELHGEFARH